MALTITQINATTHKYIEPSIADNIFNSNPVWKRLHKKADKIDGGVKIDFPVLYGKVAGGSYSGYDTLTTTPQDVASAAEASWKQYYANVTISGLDRIQNKGVAAVLSVLKVQFASAERTIRDQLGTDLYGDGTGNGSKAIDGLKEAVDDGSNYASYLGINRSTYTWWKANVNFPGVATAISLQTMENNFGSCVIEDDHPTVITTTQAVYDKLWGLFQIQQRFNAGGPFKAGTSHITFNDVEVMVDSHVPSKTIWFLNEKYIELKVDKDTNFKVTEFVRPSNQDAETAQILFAGNMGVTDPRMFLQANNQDPTL